MPQLELLVHGGMHMAPYRPLFDQLLEGSRAAMRETYASSEGFIGVSDRGPGEGLRLIVDNGVFFEFVPVEELDAPRPTRHWVADVELGREYAIVLSTRAGLWSYLLGDTVRFVTLAPPRLLITGRLGSWLSAFGEHVIEIELETAVAAAAAAMGRTAVDYTVSSIKPRHAGESGYHRYLVEFAPPSSSDEQQVEFARRVDAELQRLNEDYRLLRLDGRVLKAPEVVVLPAGTFAQWMRQRGKMGGQNKVPRVSDASNLQRDLEETAARLATHPTFG